MRPSARLNGGQLARARTQFSNFQRRSRAPIYERGGVLSRAPTFLNRVPRDRRSGRCVDLRLAAGLPGADGDGGGLMAEYQLGADGTRRTTVGALWETMSGRPLSADLLDWPPDLFALTSVMLQRSGAYRFALSPPPGHQWPPGSRSGWSTTVETAGRVEWRRRCARGAGSAAARQHDGGLGGRGDDAVGRPCNRRQLGTLCGIVDAARHRR